MLITAITAQISAIRTTWAALTEWVVVITDARNDPRSSTAFGVTALAGHDCSTTAVAPMPSPTEPRPMATFAHAAHAGLDAPLRQPGVHLLVDLRADPRDQPLGHGAVVRSAEFGMRGRRCGDILVCPYVHVAKLYRD